MTIRDLIVKFGGWVKLLIPIMMGLALLGFFWGLAVFIFQSGNEQGVEKGKNIMKWGLVALFVMVSVWGLVTFIGDSLGISGGGILQVQTL